jgi:hypothetical protein
MYDYAICIWLTQDTREVVFHQRGQSREDVDNRPDHCR